MAVMKRVQRDRLPEDAGVQRLLFRRRRLGVSRSASSRCARPAMPTRSRARRCPAGSNGCPTCRSTRSRGTRWTSGCRPRICRTPTTASTTRTARSISTSSRPTPRRSKHLKRKLKEVLAKIGWPAVLLERSLYLGKDIPLSGTAHQAGTCRFGTDPATSVLEPRLPRARGRQPLRHRRELLPVDRRGEPDADDHRQRAARGRHHQGAAVSAAAIVALRRPLRPGAAVPAVQRARQGPGLRAARSGRRSEVFKPAAAGGRRSCWRASASRCSAAGRRHRRRRPRLRASSSPATAR